MTRDLRRLLATAVFVSIAGCGSRSGAWSKQSTEKSLSLLYAVDPESGKAHLSR